MLTEHAALPTLQFPPEWGSKTVLGAFEELYRTLGATGTVTHVPGVDINGADIQGAGGVSAALSATASHDVVVVIFGEPVYTEKPGDIDDLSLPRPLTVRDVSPLPPANLSTVLAHPARTAHTLHTLHLHMMTARMLGLKLRLEPGLCGRPGGGGDTGRRSAG